MNGGAEGIRTPDLLIANETLYQLSYDPYLEGRGAKGAAANALSKQSARVPQAESRKVDGELGSFVLLLWSRYAIGP